MWLLFPPKICNCCLYWLESFLMSLIGWNNLISPCFGTCRFMLKVFLVMIDNSFLFHASKIITLCTSLRLNGVKNKALFFLFLPYPFALKNVITRRIQSWVFESCKFLGEKLALEESAWGLWHHEWQLRWSPSHEMFHGHPGWPCCDPRCPLTW